MGACTKGDSLDFKYLAITNVYCTCMLTGPPVKNLFTEKAIFDFLKLEYKSPTERNCFDLSFVEDEERDAKTKTRRRR